MGIYLERPHVYEKQRGREPVCACDDAIANWAYKYTFSTYPKYIVSTFNHRHHHHQYKNVLRDITVLKACPPLPLPLPLPKNNQQ